MIAFIGGGNMAEALIKGMKEAGSKEEIIVLLKKDLGIVSIPYRFYQK